MKRIRWSERSVRHGWNVHYQQRADERIVAEGQGCDRVENPAGRPGHPAPVPFLELENRQQPVEQRVLVHAGNPSACHGTSWYGAAWPMPLDPRG
jgi:hypothetical protein